MSEVGKHKERAKELAFLSTVARGQYVAPHVPVLKSQYSILDTKQCLTLN